MTSKEWEDVASIAMKVVVFIWKAIKAFIEIFDFFENRKQQQEPAPAH